MGPRAARARGRRRRPGHRRDPGQPPSPALLAQPVEVRPGGRGERRRAGARAPVRTRRAAPGRRGAGRRLPAPRLPRLNRHAHAHRRPPDLADHLGPAPHPDAVALRSAPAPDPAADGADRGGRARRRGGLPGGIPGAGRPGAHRRPVARLHQPALRRTPRAGRLVGAADPQAVGLRGRGPAPLRGRPHRHAGHGLPALQPRQRLRAQVHVRPRLRAALRPGGRLDRPVGARRRPHRARRMAGAARPVGQPGDCAATGVAAVHRAPGAHERGDRPPARPAALPGAHRGDGPVP